MRALRRQNTLVRVLVVAGTLLVAGVLALFASAAVAPETRASQPAMLSAERASDVLGELGSLLIGSAALAVLWDLVARRAFLDELLEQIDAVESLAVGGVTGMTMNFHETIPWQKLIDEAKTVDVMMAWGAGWRAICIPHLGEMMRRSRTRIRVVLPDPEDDALMEALANRFDSTADQVRTNITQAADDFLALRPDKHPDRVAVMFTSERLLFACYLIDRTAVISFYTHAPHDRPVAAFSCIAEGDLFEFVRGEFDLFSTGAVKVRSA